MLAAAPKVTVPACARRSRSRRLDPPPVRRAPAACASGPQLVQIGAFGETDQVQRGHGDVEGLEQVRVEPAFAGDRALARVRLGPVADPAGGRCSSWSAWSALGYTDAFMVPASGTGRAALVSC